MRGIVTRTYFRVSSGAIFFACCFLLVAFCSKVLAAPLTAGSTGSSIPLADKNAPNGSIVSFINSKYSLSTVAYDPTIFGVVSDNPATSYIDTTIPNSRLVVQTGRVYVLVSTVNGVIKPGDFITTSNIKGIGQKATEPGYVLGNSVEGYSDTKKPGLILVEMHPEFGKQALGTRQNLITSIKLGVRAATLSPENALRYVVASMIVIASFAFGFIFFGRISSRGVEAVGRNPLAGKLILASVVFNVFLAVVIVLIGVAVGYLILVL